MFFKIWWCWIQIWSQFFFNMLFSRKMAWKFEKMLFSGGFRDPPTPHTGGIQFVAYRQNLPTYVYFEYFWNTAFFHYISLYLYLITLNYNGNSHISEIFKIGKFWGCRGWGVSKKTKTAFFRTFRPFYGKWDVEKNYFRSGFSAIKLGQKS